MIEDFYEEAQIELQARRVLLRSQAARFRAAAAETHTTWRLGLATVRRSNHPEVELFRSGVAEILTLRLIAAHNPIFKTLQRIENQLAILADLREDMYAPPSRVVRRRPASQVPLRSHAYYAPDAARHQIS